MINFKITAKESKKIEKWLKEDIYPLVIALQKKSNFSPFAAEAWESDIPYGGSLTYEFTPTAIGLGYGVVYKVEDMTFKLELTDFDSW